MNAKTDSGGKPYSPTDEAAATKFGGGLLSGNEPANLKLGVRACAVALDRWSRDLERDPDAREYDTFEEAVRDAATDTLDYYADEDAHVEGVDGLVFEGMEITEDHLVERALGVLETIEAEAEFSRDEPGGIVERVGTEASA